MSATKLVIKNQDKSANLFKKLKKELKKLEKNLKKMELELGKEMRA